MTTKLKYNELKVGNLYKGISASENSSHSFKNDPESDPDVTISIDYGFTTFMFLEYKDLGIDNFNLKGLRILIDNKIVWIRVWCYEEFVEIKQCQ